MIRAVFHKLYGSPDLSRGLVTLTTLHRRVAMTVTNSILRFSSARNLSDTKACIDAQAQRLRFIPPDFVRNLPLKPYCTNNLKHGVVIRPVEQAIRKPYLEINPPKMVHWLIFDIDRDNGAFAWQDSPGLKAPNFAVVNPKNGHAHLYYKLSVPVCRSEMAHIKPLRYLSAIEYTYCNGLEADKAYSGLISKNPLHPAHSLILFRPLSRPYSLAEMAENVDLETKPKREISTGVGRNVDLFENARQWAYKAISGYWRPNGLSEWKQALRTHCTTLNTFSVPLPESEIRAISESIASWTWKRLTPQGRQELIDRTHTPELQAERARRRAQRHREAKAEDMSRAKEMASEGLSQKVIAETLGVTQSTVSRWLQS